MIVDNLMLSFMPDELNTTKSKISSSSLPSTNVTSEQKTSSSSNQDRAQIPSPAVITNSSNKNNLSNNNNGKKCTKLTSKGDLRHVGPSSLRQLLPVALCILSFATVVSILIVYMDTTEIRHQQFRLNMSRDYELIGVSQDDPTLIAFIREIHMKKNPMNFLKNAPIEHINFTERHELTSEMAQYIGNLVNYKQNGAFIQSLTSTASAALTGPWLAETLNWDGIIIEPEPRKYFSLRKQNFYRPKVQVIHACVSPNEYPKEVTIHNEEDADVRINSLLDEESSSFNSRVKCFPLYTMMLAVSKTDYDLLSLGGSGYELQILETLPFDKVQIKILSIHLTDQKDSITDHIKNITKFLHGKSYRLQKSFENNYIYLKIR